MKTSTLLLVLIGILVVLAAVQTFQVTALAKVISSGAISSGSAGSSVLTQLPSQVGGC